MESKEIKFKLNGKIVRTEVKPYDKLLEVLRDKLGVKSPKYGCGRGECGACSVLLDGKAVRSCLIYAVEVDDHEVFTLEGLQANGLTDLQKSFLKHNSFQCGFCAPGMVIQITELLRENPHPDEEEIREYISGNLCRCTGYSPIVEAVLDVVKNK